MKKDFFYALRGILLMLLLVNSGIISAGPGGQNTQEQDKKNDTKGNKDKNKGSKKDNKDASAAQNAAAATTGVAVAGAAGAAAVTANAANNAQQANSTTSNAQPTQLAQAQPANTSQKNESKESKKDKNSQKNLPIKVVQAPGVAPVVQDTSGGTIVLQPPVVQITQGNVLSATINGVDVTDDFKSLLAYSVYFKKYPGAKGIEDVFEGDPVPKAGKETTYCLLFADGTRKDIVNKTNSPLFTQPFQVLEGRYGSVGAKKNKAVGYTDITRYLQDNIFAHIDGNLIKNERNPARVQALKTILQAIKQKTLQVTLNGMETPPNYMPWQIKTTLRAPGASQIGSTKPQPQWVAQDWSGKVPAKILKNPQVTITAAGGGKFRKAEEATYQKLPAALQAVANENKTADPNIKVDKKGNVVQGKSNAPAA